MSDRSAIEWTDATWNPLRAVRIPSARVKDDFHRSYVRGWYCEHVSAGCEHCYAERINKRLGTGLPFKPGHRKDIEIILDEKTLLAPLRWKKPRMIFVCSMSDLFGDWVDGGVIDEIFAVIGACEQAGLDHQFQVLTKRAARMQEYMTMRAHRAWNLRRLATEAFPPRNIWLGVSAEDQQRADERIPLLLDTAAAVRFVSLEPLLSDIQLHPLACGTNALSSSTGPNLDWVIVGGESGPGARPMHPDWARNLREQCTTADVPFFFKQWGEWAPIKEINTPSYSGPADGMYRFGKKAAGRLLDGVEHNGMPAVTADSSW